MQNTLIRLITGAVSKDLHWPGFLTDYAAMTQRMKNAGEFTVAGLDVRTDVGVYQPSNGSSTQFIVDHLAELLPNHGKSVLEIGCGSGVLALLAARCGLKVDACDIDPRAVACTNENARRNGIPLVACESDLFDAFDGRKYDLILFNLPFYHTPGPISDLERPLADPNGSLITRFLDNAHDHLTAGGQIAFTFANCGQIGVLQRGDWDMHVAGLDYHQRNNFVRLIIRARPRRVADLPSLARDVASAMAGERY